MSKQTNEQRQTAREQPFFWKTRLADIEDELARLKTGRAGTLGYSAGNRPIRMATYGEKESFNRQANYSSALAAGDAKYYADKRGQRKPILMIIGAVHGGEMEGIAAILNLIHILETGSDFRGRRWDHLYQARDNYRLLLIPCANPDGRSHVPVDTMIGLTFDEFRYYLQGTWKDGTLCGWPACKQVHPIAGHVQFLGGYFNDDGINVAADNMFLHMANETRLLLQLADDEAPDFTVQLHGGDNCINMTLPLRHVPEHIRQKQYAFDLALSAACQAKGLKYNFTPIDNDTKATTGYYASFCMDSAIHHICGGISLTYESNMGLNDGEYRLSEDEILDHHLTLFETMFRFCQPKEEAIC